MPPTPVPEGEYHATFTVTTLVDIVDPNDGLTSLREAIAFANDEAGADTITFDAAGAFAADALIRLIEGEITITDTLTIDGSTAGGTLTITGDKNGNDITDTNDITDIWASHANSRLNDNTQIFVISGADNDTTLNSLTLTGGVQQVLQGLGGGAVQSDGELIVTDSVFSGNNAAESGGAIWAASLILTDSAVTNNVAADTFDPAFDVSDAGGIFASGSVTVRNSVISNNTVVADDGLGGGILAAHGTVTLIDSVVSGNKTDAQGGGVYALNVEAIGSTIDGNSVDDAVGETFAVSGGGITATNDLTLVNSTVSNNGISSSSGNFGQSGGGGAAAKNILAINSTIVGNSTAGSTLYGGGLFAWGSMDLTNSTVTGNTTASPLTVGGGLFAGKKNGPDNPADFLPIHLTNSIVMGNSTHYSAAGTGGVGQDVGGDELFGSTTVFAGGNIVGGALYDGATNIGAVTAAQIFAIPVETLANSYLLETHGFVLPEFSDTIADFPTGVFGGGLADNGGPVQTVALLADASNPALDTSNASAPANDARGEGRIDQAGLGNETTDIADLGAYEVQTQLGAAPNSAPTGGDGAGGGTGGGTGDDVEVVGDTVGDTDGGSGFDLPSFLDVDEFLAGNIATNIPVSMMAYLFYAQIIPTEAGFEYLIGSDENPNDLNDSYYDLFNPENAFLNFSSNLAFPPGAGASFFEETYGDLSYAETLALAYEEVIGVEAAEQAGINVDEAFSFFQSAETIAFFEAVAVESGVVREGVNLEDAVKAVLIVT